MESHTSSGRKKGENKKGQSTFKGTWSWTRDRDLAMLNDESPTVLITNQEGGLRKKQSPTARNQGLERRMADSLSGELQEPTTDAQPEDDVLRDLGIGRPEDPRPSKRSKITEVVRSERKRCRQTYSCTQDLLRLSASFKRCARDHLGMVLDVLQSRDHLDAERAMELIELLVKSWSQSRQLIAECGSEATREEEFWLSTSLSDKSQ